MNEYVPKDNSTTFDCYFTFNCTISDANHATYYGLKVNHRRALLVPLSKINQFGAKIQLAFGNF